MLLIKIHGDSREQSAESIQNQIAAKAEPTLQQAETTGVVSEILKARPGAVIQAVKAQVMEMGGIGIRVRRTVVRGYNVNLGTNPPNAVDFGHDAQNVRLVLKKMREINAIRAVVGKWPRKTRQISQHIRCRAWLSINSYRIRFLFSFAAAQVEDQHGK